MVSKTIRIKRQVGLMTVLLLAAFLGRPANGTASSGAEFLRLDIPARAGALSAGCADFVELDIYNRNPSGLAGKLHPEIAFTHFIAFDEFVYEQLDAAYPNWLGGTWSGRLFYASGADFTEYDDQGMRVGTIDYHDFLLHLTYSHVVGKDVEAGVGLKVLESRLDEYSSIGAALDMGVRYRTPLRWLALGLAMQNVGARTAFISEADPLPMQLVAGVGLFFSLYEGHRVKILADYTQPLGLEEDGYATAGLEYGFLKMLFLRGGYRFKNELGELSLGAGFRLANIGLDYAYQPFSNLGIAHRFTLSYVFLQQEKKAVPPSGEKAPGRHAKVRELRELPRHFESAVTFKTPKVDPRIKDWRFEIRDQKGNMVKSITGMGKPPDYLKWDGKNQQGRLMPKKNQYQLIFKAEGKPAASREIPAFQTPRRLYFKDGSILEPEVLFQLDKDYPIAQWTLQMVEKKTQKTVRTLTGKDRLPGKILWDGKDSQGQVAATNRRYSYVLQLVYADRTSVLLSGKIRSIPVRLFATQTGGKGILIPGILFDFDSAAFKPAMMDKILAANTILEKYPERSKLVCAGHSDDVGGVRYNQQLSAMRAAMVGDYILKKTGVASDRVRSQGYGKSRPVSRANTEKARACNRRVEIRIFFPDVEEQSK